MTSKSIILPRGKIGVTFDGSPPKVIRVTKDSPVQGTVEEGLYAQTLIVPGCEMSFIPYAARMVADLKYFQDLDRTLILRDTPQIGPPVWKISLPVGPVGIVMKGFPPIITQVDANSELKDFIQVGMTVDRLIVPGVCDMNLATGGFTDARVTKILNDNQTVEGRILVLTLVLEGVPTGNPKTKNMAFDIDSLLPSKGWTLKRMFT